MTRIGKGSVTARVKSVFAAVGLSLAMTVAATPAFAVDVGAPAAAADAQGFARAARAAASNNAYNMAGATYAVYRDKACTQDTGQRLIVADNSGVTNEIELVAGTYYVKEINPDLNRGFTGYIVSPNVHTLTVNAGQVATIDDATEPMIYDNVKNDIVNKGLTETSVTGRPEGDIHDLSGVEFRLDFRTYLYPSIAAAEADGNVDASVTLRTDAQGRVTGEAFANGSAIVKGSWPFKVGNRNIIPLGTVVLTETKVPDGMQLNGEKRGFKVMDANLNEATMKNTAVTKAETATKRVQLSTWREGGAGPSTHNNTVNRGALTVIKADLDRDLALAAGASSTKATEAQGDATLQGVTYRVSNESEHPVWIHKDTDGLLKRSPVTADGYVEFAVGEDILELKSRDLGNNRYGISTANEVLPYGTYKVRETAPSTGYNVNEGWYRTFTIRGKGYRQMYDRNVFSDNGNTADNVNSWNANPVIRGGVRVTKLDSEIDEMYGQGGATVNGAEFTIKNKSAKSVIVNGVEYAPNADIMTIVTGEDGWAATRADELPYGTYELRETAAPEGYHLNADWRQTFTIRNESVVSINPGAEDDVIRGGLSVIKRDADLDETYPQGDATTMAGTVFTIKNISDHDVMVKGVRYQSGADVMTITTDAKGFATTGKTDLPYGEYEVRETKAPAGYLLNADWRAFINIRKQGEIVAAADTNNDEPIRGGIEVFKVDGITGDGTASGDATFEGTEFTIKNISDNDVVVNGKRFKSGTDIMTIAADKTGRAATGERILPYGTYELRETKAPIGYDLNKDWRATATIRTDGVIVRASSSLGDNPTPFVLVVKKVDSDGVNTGQGDTTLSNCTFEVENASAGPISYKGKTYQPGEKVTELTTGEYNEELDCYPINIDLPMGTYKITEIDANSEMSENPVVYTVKIGPQEEFE